MSNCEMGCKHFYGAEIQHHENCFYYPGSLSELKNKLATKVTSLESLLAAEKAKSDQLLSALKECVEHRGGWMAIDYAKIVITEYNTPELPVSDLEER